MKIKFLLFFVILTFSSLSSALDIKNHKCTPFQGANQAIGELRISATNKNISIYIFQNGQTVTGSFREMIGQEIKYDLETKDQATGWNDTAKLSYQAYRTAQGEVRFLVLSEVDNGHVYKTDFTCTK